MMVRRRLLMPNACLVDLELLTNLPSNRFVAGDLAVEKFPLAGDVFWVAGVVKELAGVREAAEGLAIFHGLLERQHFAPCRGYRPAQGWECTRGHGLQPGTARCDQPAAALGLALQNYQTIL